jgi:hypothetical protein
MNVPSRLPHAPLPAPEKPVVRALPHTAGFTDAFGERHLVFDPAAGLSLEVLRFKREFSDSPEFEGALLARLEGLSTVQHPSLATVHSVDRVSDHELTLVSKHTPGKRMSELFPKAQGPAFALELIRLVTPALATLQRAGDGMAHGVLSADRIVVTRDGRLVVVEHVLGAAIESLHLSRQRLNQLGLVVPPGTEPVQFDGRTDIAQLGFIALSLLIGRRLSPEDYPEKVPALLDEFARTANSPMLAAKLRTWLERAMQISPRSFASARDAQAALGDLPDDQDVQVAAAASMPVPNAFPQEAAIAPAESSASERQASGPSLGKDATRPANKSGGRRFATWAIIGLALLAAGEGVALFVWPYMRPPAEVIEVRPATAALIPPAASTQLPPPAASPEPVASLAANPAAPAPLNTNPTPPAAESAVATPVPPAPTTPAGPRFGGMTVVSAMELQVFENGKPLGSTAGPIALNEGQRIVEFVNETTGFKHRQTVAVKGGQMTTVNIALPNGRLSINAVPWAEVEINGKSLGETPLANVSLPIGTHEITFRHPQLGTRKQTVVVKADGMTRVTQTFTPGAGGDR